MTKALKSRSRLAVLPDFKVNDFGVTFDGQKVIEEADDSFTAAGKVGVWIKARGVNAVRRF